MSHSPAAARTAAWSFTLPLFLTRRNRIPTIAACGVVATLMYLGSNHFHLFEPGLLPMSWVDRTIPFIPWTVWIYTSEFALFFAVLGLSRDLRNTNKYLYAFLGLQTVSVTIFVLWPTTFPRDLYPLPTDIGSWTFALFNNLRTTDTPANCAPSLHVSSCYLSSFVFLEERRPLFPWFFAWSTAIAISTLTTKQHYLVDVALGFLFAAIFYWLFYRWMPYRDVHAKR
ncbi:MAG: phosphatase PAP2 family protein [Bdellovibrionales bacterium]|nr:phosphatase PAP2 family protein [Bdellovibrionales bacterium]